MAPLLSCAVTDGLKVSFKTDVEEEEEKFATPTGAVMTCTHFLSVCCVTCDGTHTVEWASNRRILFLSCLHVLLCEGLLLSALPITNWPCERNVHEERLHNQLMLAIVACQR